MWGAQVKRVNFLSVELLHFSSLYFRTASLCWGAYSRRQCLVDCWWWCVDGGARCSLTTYPGPIFCDFRIFLISFAGKQGQGRNWTRQFNFPKSLTCQFTWDKSQGKTRHSWVWKLWRFERNEQIFLILLWSSFQDILAEARKSFNRAIHKFWWQQEGGNF